jgi:transcriptional regulator with XRE-family HTH domain
VDDETFGTAVRRWRDRLTPASVGLPDQSPRRAAGLRREELGALAGLSVDYIVRLEQGRATHPSTQVVATLARSLQLSTEERDHAYRLAGLLPPASGTVSTHISPGVQRILGRLSDFPVGVFSADWTLLTWTPPWTALIGDPSGRTPRQRNLVRAVFAKGSPGLSGWPVRHADVGLEAALVADLRTALVDYPKDIHLSTLVAEMRENSPEFARLWTEGGVGKHVSSRKTIEHPEVGDITCDCDVLTVPGSDVRLVVYSAADGTPDSEKLEFLRVTGGRPVVEEPAEP